MENVIEKELQSKEIKGIALKWQLNWDSLKRRLVYKVSRPLSREATRPKLILATPLRRRPQAEINSLGIYFGIIFFTDPCRYPSIGLQSYRSLTPNRLDCQSLSTTHTRLAQTIQRLRTTPTFKKKLISALRPRSQTIVDEAEINFRFAASQLRGLGALQTSRLFRQAH